MRKLVSCHLSNRENESNTLIQLEATFFWADGNGSEILDFVSTPSNVSWAPSKVSWALSKRPNTRFHRSKLKNSTVYKCASKRSYFLVFNMLWIITKLHCHYMARNFFSKKAKFDYFINYTFILQCFDNLLWWNLIFLKNDSFLHHFTKAILSVLRFLLNSQQVKLDGFGRFYVCR